MSGEDTKDDVQDSLLDDLDNLENEDKQNPEETSGTDGDISGDNDNPDNVGGDTNDNEDPTVNVVDAFASGDLDAVRQAIHDRVVKTVTDVIQTPVKETPPEEASEVPDTPEE